MERPIIFSTEMVKAILNGRKTQTRRVVNFPEHWKRQGIAHDDLEKSGFWNCWQSCVDDPTAGHRWQYGDDFLPRQNYQCGDELWVRETFGNPIGKEPPIYRATDEDPDYPIMWNPSIFMPKKYARIWLEIINVRVERLNEISVSDAKAEGVEYSSFATLWDSINGKKHPWSSNPWVWVVEFKRVKND